MTTENNTQEQGTDFLSMSDEEIMQMSEPPAQVIETPVVGEEVVEEVKEVPGDEAKGEEKDDDEGEETPKVDAPNDGKGGGGEEVTPEAKETKPAVEENTEEVKPEFKVDYEAEYKRILAPFKANGKDIQVDSVEDVVALMKMGANYNKKMAALKPSLKVMKALETHGLMSEDKIGFLIDLARKDPAAINKLVKDSGIDPMDLTAEKANSYQRTNYSVDDREIELDTVLDELQGSDTYTRTLDVVSNKWDAASKQVISGQPQLLKIIDSHMASGIYDRISNEVEKERMLGRLNGLSDLLAYRQVGDAIEARGGFSDLVQPKAVTKPPLEIVAPKAKPAEDDKLKDKRRAASSAKPVVPATTKEEFNPLSMSDAEFNKLLQKQYA